MSSKIRLDMLLVERGLAVSRAQAQGLVMAGVVFCGGVRFDKPGHKVDFDVDVEVRGKSHPYVSRGGLKLAGGLDHFTDINLKNMVAVDVGASTGGFSDVLLRRGVARVYAVDVGHGQLAWALRNDARVVVLERVNARYLTLAQIPEPLDIVVCDASFISLKKLLPAALALAREGAWLLALIKPQFEVGRGEVGKGGVVRDAALHQAVQDDIAAWLESEAGWHVKGITESPITGPQGNREFIIAARKPQQ